ncbi:MAG: glycosyltransferase family 39 protein [Vicinamibacterales bacterium]
MKRVIPFGILAVLVASALGDHYFRDEFYYLACSRRLAWGYVDQPPLSIAVLWLVRHLAGESLLVLRCIAALVSALTAWMTGRIAARLGGSDFAQVLAMTAYAIAPALLAVASFYSMNVFDLFFWTLAVLVLIDVLDRPSLWRWVALGVVLGAGLQNKISVLWLGAGLAAGLVFTPARRHLLTPGPWAAALVAAVIFAPHVLWQTAHGWPTLEFIRNASAEKMQSTAPLTFVVEQIVNMHPLTLPIWLAGLGFVLFAPRATRYRPIGIAFLAVGIILMFNQTSRSGYLAPGYPMLYGAGGVALEAVLRRSAWRAAALAILVAGGAMTAPLALPLLPVDAYVRYSAALGVAPDTEEKKELARLPQFFADRQGWDLMVDAVAAVYDALPPAERRSAAVMTNNYGEAGAIEHLGGRRGLTAISGHNNYWLWGPGAHTGEVLIVLTRSRERLEERFTSVERAGQIECGDCMPYENGLPIFVCRGLKPPALAARWQSFKHFD